MIFRELAGLGLLAFIPLFFLIAKTALRRRQVTLPSYFIIKDLIETLPVLPRSFLLRKKLQFLFLLAALCFLALAAANPFLGQPDARPLNVIVALDHLSHGKDPDGKGDAWSGVTRSAREVIGPLRQDDGVLLVRTDTGSVSRDFLSPRRAAASIRDLSPSLLPLRPKATHDHLALLAESHRADHVVIVTPSPARWQEFVNGRDGTWRIIRSAPPPGALNYGIVDVEVRPRLFRPGKLDLFCRVGVYGAEKSKRPLTATLTVSRNEEPVASETLSLSPGESRGVVLRDLAIEPGLLTLKVDPSDWFPDDNTFTTPVRSLPDFDVTLVTTGNHALESALRSIGGLSLTVAPPGPSRDGSRGALAIFDGFVPERLGTSALVIRPFENLPGLSFLGETLGPEVITTEETHPLIQGVSFDELRVRRLPIFMPNPDMSVIARADGYPLLLSGEGGVGSRMVVIGFNPLDSGWIYDPSFPILVANIVSWLREETSGSLSSFKVGDSLDDDFLQDVRSITGPDGKVHTPSVSSTPYTFSRAGKFRVRGQTEEASGSLYANLVNDDVSRLVAMTGDEGGGDLPPQLQDRPFRLELGKILLALGLAMLFLEALIAPSARVGRLPE